MNIFIVEDNLTLRTELMSFLNNYQFTCSTSDNFGNIVNEILESKADLVLLDINLPNMDGYYVCKEVRRSSNIPIIIVTSRDSDMDEIMSMNMGADDFITKCCNIFLTMIGWKASKQSTLGIFPRVLCFFLLPF